MAAKKSQIVNAWQMSFGRKPTPSEIKEVQNKPDFYGNSASAVFDKLKTFPEYQKKEISDREINEAYQQAFGQNASDDEIQEIKDKTDYYGKTAASVLNRLKESPRYKRQQQQKNQQKKKQKEASKQKGGDQKVRIPKGETSQPADKSGSKDTYPSDSQDQTPSISGPGGMPDETDAAEIKAGQPSNKDIRDNLLSIGIKPDTIEQMSPEMREYFGSIGAKMIKNVKDQNPMPAVITAKDLDRIREDVKNDPDINSYYKEKVDRYQEEFTENVARIQKDWDYTLEKKQRKFQEQRKETDRRKAKLGQTFSGIREKAEQKEKEEQKGIIESERRKVKKELDDLQERTAQQIGSERVPEADLTGTMEGMDFDMPDKVEAEGYDNIISKADSQLERDKAKIQEQEVQTELQKQRALRGLNTQ